jgi:hypothetical protein
MKRDSGNRFSRVPYWKAAEFLVVFIPNNPIWVIGFFFTIEEKLVTTRKNQLTPAVMAERHNVAVPRICHQMELIDGVTKISSQNNTDRDTMCDQHIVLTVIYVKRSPQRIQKR